MIDGSFMRWNRAHFTDDGAGILVTPLQPPFSRDVMFFEFESGGARLAVSKSDGDRIKEFLNGKAQGRSIVMEAVPADRTKIRIHLAQ